MDDQNKANCSKCGRAKEAKRVSSITQWISVCACNIEPPAEEYSQEIICSICEKRISEVKSGRITQWLFKDNFCKCNKPEPLVEVSIKSKPLFKTAEGDLVTEEELVEETEISVENNFPKDRYKPLKRLGTGAAGSVYLCRDKFLKKLVALKMLHVLTPEQLISFQQEAKSTSRLNHPNIIEILDFGATDNGAPYMVIEWFEGESLKNHLQSSGPLSVSQAIEVFSKIAYALDYAHSQSIYHRDLKPSNIMVSFQTKNNPEVLLIDFGVAYVKRETLEPTIFQGNSIAGTPAYMSPDLGLGFTYDERSEIYSLGCTMFEAITGDRPYTGDTSMGILSKHATSDIPDIDIDDKSENAKQLASIIQRCLAKNPEDRFQTMEELARALTESSSIQTSQNLSPVKPKKRRLKSTVLILPVIAFGLVCLFYTSRPRQRPIQKTTEQLKEDERFNMIPLEAPIPGRNKMDKKPLFAKTVTKGLVEIKPRFFELTNKDVLLLLKEPQINDLDLSNSYINGENLDLLLDKNIQVLKLKYCPITEKGFSTIGKLTSLKRLNLRDSKATNNIHYLAGLTNLRSMDLSNCDITDEDLNAIKGLVKIHSLNLAYSGQFTGKSLKILKNFNSLASLKLQFSGVREKFLREIDWSIFPYLTNLQLDGCKYVTPETIDYLAKKYPQLKLAKDYEIGDDIKNVLKNPKSRLK